MEDREEISRQLSQGHSVTVIARSLGRSPSTIAREIRRNAGTRSRYRATVAHTQARVRAEIPRRRRRLAADPRLRAYVVARIRLRWSPEQIARRLEVEYPHELVMRISHEAIYRYLYVLPRGTLKRQLLQCLRQKRRQRRRRGRVHERRGQILDMISIDERPAEVADRTIPGHWEGDLLMGAAHSSALGTLVERTSRFTVLTPLEKKDAPAVRRAFARAIRPLPRELKRSLTYDRDKEMSEHRLFTILETVEQRGVRPAAVPRTHPRRSCHEIPERDPRGTGSRYAVLTSNSSGLRLWLV